jgi:hypothetical protein
VNRPPRRSSAPASGGSAEAPAAAPPEPRQRWRITFARDAVAPDRVGRVALDEWQGALEASGLPTLSAGGRIRLAIAAPLPAAARGERELAEIWLIDRRPGWQVREALAPRLPDGHRWVDAEDVWLGAPPVVGRVGFAEWRIELAASTELDAERLSSAVATINAAQTILRVRQKGAAEKRYDLRPLLADVRLEPDSGSPDLGAAIGVRTRFHPELGAGRPDEVVAALTDAAGVAIAIRTMTRLRLVLADDQADRAPRPGAAAGRTTDIPSG